MKHEDFWFRTNKLIKQQGKTQRSLALECGFSERRIETLSSTNRSPDILEAVVLAKALNVSVEYLVTGKEPCVDKNKIISDYLKEKLSEITSHT